MDQTTSLLLMKGHLGGDVGLAAVFAVSGPLRGEIEAVVDQGLAPRRDIGEKDTDLAIIDFAETATPLAGDATGLLALLGEGRGVEHEHAVGVAQFGGDVAAQFGQDGVIGPAAGANEMLQGASFQPDIDGDGLGGLALQTGELALEEDLGMLALPVAIEERGGQCDKAGEVLGTAADGAGLDFGLGQQLLGLGVLKDSGHKDPPPESAEGKSSQISS